MYLTPPNLEIIFNENVDLMIKLSLSQVVFCLITLKGEPTFTLFFIHIFQQLNQLSPSHQFQFCPVSLTGFQFIWFVFYICLTSPDTFRAQSLSSITDHYENVNSLLFHTTNYQCIWFIYLNSIRVWQLLHLLNSKYFQILYISILSVVYIPTEIPSTTQKKSMYFSGVKHLELSQLVLF